MFEVGQIVKVKEWEEMEEEFGLDDFDSIDCDFAFTYSMRVLCGEKFEVEDVLHCEDGIELLPNYELCSTDFKVWSISTDMVKLVEEDI